MSESKYVQCVNDAINSYLSAYEYELVFCMENCESPIEQLMALALNEMARSWIVNNQCNKFGIDIVDIQTQEEIISSSGKKYRPDFIIPVLSQKIQESKCFAIECDGHEFHEKTKQQVIHDKQRERELVEKGYTVIRFSGSEIYKNADKCAAEVFQIIFRNFMEH